MAGEEEKEMGLAASHGVHLAQRLVTFCKLLQLLL